MEKQQELLSGIREYYVPLQIALSKRGKLQNSCIPNLWKMNTKSRREIFEISARPSYIIKKDAFDYLFKEGYLIEFEDSNLYILTIKGIWFYETKKLNLKEDLIYNSLTEELIKRSFSTSKKDLSDRQKLILFGLFAMRCFSKEACINLIQTKKFEYWKEIFEKSINFLEQNQYSKKFNLQEIFDKNKTKHPVSNLVMSNSTELSKLTKGIYKSGGEGIWFLDILDNKEINKDKLNIIFEKIFGNISLQKKEKILDFSNEVLKDYDIKIFDNLKEAYTHPEVNKKIKDIILSF